MSEPSARNWFKAVRLASTAFSSASSMPATAFSSSASGSTPARVLRIAPRLAASETALSAERMFLSVISRPCRACKVACEAASRNCLPPRAEAFWKAAMSASWSNMGWGMAGLLREIGTPFGRGAWGQAAGRGLHGPDGRIRGPSGQAAG